MADDLFVIHQMKLQSKVESSPKQSIYICIYMLCFLIIAASLPVSNFDPESMMLVTSPNFTVGGTNTNKRGSRDDS